MQIYWAPLKNVKLLNVIELKFSWYMVSLLGGWITPHPIIWKHSYHENLVLAFCYSFILNSSFRKSEKKSPLILRRTQNSISRFYTAPPPKSVRPNRTKQYSVGKAIISHCSSQLRFFVGYHFQFYKHLSPFTYHLLSWIKFFQLVYVVGWIFLILWDINTRASLFSHHSQRTWSSHISIINCVIYTRVIPWIYLFLNKTND